MHRIRFATTTRSADLMLVLSLWHELKSEWEPGTDPMSPMRRRHTRESLARFLGAGDASSHRTALSERACGFDVVLRLASGKIDTMHATYAFFAHEENSQWFAPVDLAVAGRRRTVRGVSLTPAALALWKDAAEQERMRALGDARRLLEGDIESGGTLVRLLPVQETAPSPVLHPIIGDRKAYVEAVARSIQEEAFQPAYRKRAFGTAVRGWDARLHAYFWPTPSQNYAVTHSNVSVLAERSRRLADALAAQGAWTAAEQQEAVELAHAVFAWGGVPQDPDTVTPNNVQQVYRAALDNDGAARAKMNSGWTKVAAFATAHLEEHGRSQAIWDSRVAAALTHRLDRLLPVEADLAALFPHLGTVPGRGGTRPRLLSRRWPSGYQTWAGQIAASQLVREVRDVLNSGDYPAMPLAEGGSGKWTTRGVEMVLFMDGY